MATEKRPVLDEKQVTLARKRLEFISGFMVVRYMFVYQILAMMTKNPKAGMGTMGVKVSNGNLYLAYDPNFVMGLTDAQLTWVLYHEIMHPSLGHCTHRMFMVRDEDGKTEKKEQLFEVCNHDLVNIAMDLAVNELIPEVPGSCEKIPGCCFVDDFKKQPGFEDIKNKQTSEWYYGYLRQKQKEQGKSGKGKTGKQFDDHSGWDPNDEIADAKMRAKIEEIAKSNAWGNVSGAEQEIILAAQVRKVNWRNILRQYYGNQAWHEKESTRKRPNRRTGLIHPGSKRIQVNRHLAEVDTSGSVVSEYLEGFLAVLNQISDYVPLDVGQFDYGLTQEPRPFDRRVKEYKFLGRGGTSFDEVMKIADERHYRSVVILTDGQAPAPPKPKAHVIWVLPSGCNPPVDWGMVVHMERFA